MSAWLGAGDRTLPRQLSGAGRPTAREPIPANLYRLHQAVPAQHGQDSSST
jgi:hypothetical protein